uniref:serine/threonine-protein kinase ATR n=1 Tax=Osmia lignaria TaxID=473952 RepID=UPI001478ED8D|nr:serine/threonine-protein kinase ATR [Osmia lignaria]XP_034192074.1 serine/threonine-protein kinase ATR [Osmia lignaria]XP_034192075.1 serine/threonine-protein kinase ATR [Osmia lignaria]
MEVNDSSMILQNNSSSVTVADSVWKFINSPVIAIFSDLKNATAKQMLSSLLESILKGSATLTTVLVPPFNNGIPNETLQCQYAAFGTWLFGIMFHIIGDPLSDNILNNSIEIQACMLRILSRHHITMFETISLEYMNILQEISEFYKTNLDENEIVLDKFNAERNIIENLDLQAFPITLKCSNIPLVQISILKIIERTGISGWNQKVLSQTILQVIMISVPNVKFVALDVCVKLMKFSLLERQEFESLILYTIEVIKGIPTWLNLNELSENQLRQFLWTLVQFIQFLPTFVNSIEVCFQIIDLTVYELIWFAPKLNAVEALKEAACNKIRLYFMKEPRICTFSEVQKLVSYFDHFPDFIDIFVQTVLIDVKYTGSKSSSVSDICKSWNLLKKELITATEMRKFDKSLHILKASRILQSWLKDLQLPTNLYTNELQDILNILLQNLNSEHCEQKKIIFENLAHLMAHNESNKDLIEKILALPFTQHIAISENVVSNHMKETARSLDNATMLKCLEVLCEYGNVTDRLKILNTCIINCDTELSIGAVLNSILLLKNGEIKLEDISKYVLQPALHSNEQKVHEMLVIVLGKMSCYLSGHATFIRDTNVTKWTIQCKRCNNCSESSSVNANIYHVSEEHDRLLNQCFSLLSSNFASVRLRISENILCFSNHISSFNNTEVAKLWFPYMEDENSVIRFNIAATVKGVLMNKINTVAVSTTSVEDDVPGSLDKFVESLINTIASALMKALRSSNHALHDTLLVTAKNCACIPLHIIERRILNIFLISVLYSTSSSAAVAFATTAYHDIAKFLNVSPKVLYIRYKRNFLKLIMQCAVYNFIQYSYNMATSIHRVAKCIGYDGSRQLLRKDGHHAVCFLLSFIVNVPNAKVLLHDIAELISMDEKQMLKEYFPYICSYAFLNMPLTTASECLELVSRITQTSLSLLTKESFMGIFEELMLNFHESPEKIVGLLKIISDYDNSLEKNFIIHKGIESYLNLRLHGILVNFDMKLGPKSDEHTQQSALASLAALMRYMGTQYLTPLRYKILATLRTSLGFKRPGFGPLVCDAWNAFIHNINVKEIGPLLPTICVSLLSLLKMYPEAVINIFKFLVIQCNEENSDYVAELFFVDDMEVPDEISTIIKARILQVRPEGFEANLKLWLKRITHDTDEVRARALTYLQKFLAEHRTKLNEMILSGTNIHPLIVDLLDTLLIGCQHKDESIRLLYGECLGELGAIEPSFLPRKIISRDDIQFISDMNEEFACAILFEHVRALQMQKSSQSMDCFSLAIQEILKTYDISPNGQNSQLWNSLPVTMRQIITPFLTSHYKIAAISDDNMFPHPIYSSELGSSVENWAYNWLYSMVSNIRDETLNNVLQACKLALKRDIKILTFCLPHVVSYIITNGTEEEHRKIREEILTIIDVRKKPTLDSELSCHRPLRHGHSVKADNTRISEETRRTRCAQIVFSVLDHLQRWLWEQRLKRDHKYEALKGFCEKLNTLVVAEGCYQSREYHRALMYLEQHMASSNKRLSEALEGGLLAKIYAQLDEPDGISGILATQDHTPTVQQLVLAHEVNGQLQDAATCYERLAQKRALKHTYLQGMIQCYLGLDQPFTAKHITEGVLRSRPELEPLMIEHEPFWRLAHFTRLDDTPQKNIKHVLLEDLKKGIKPDLLSLKKNLVSLLEDASRPGAYQQSYSYIMKLHILNEFDKAVSAMLTDVEQLPMIYEEWEKRGQLVRASRGVEFVLSMRRATLDLAVQLRQEIDNNESEILKHEIGKTWLKSAKIARKSGLHQQAYMYILSASDSCPSQQLYIEQAQLYWQKGCQEDAFTTLKRCFSSCFKPATYYKTLPTRECVEERKQCAKAKLLYARYNDETVNVDTDANIINYKEAIEVWREWEKSLLYCAQYYESVIDRMTDEEKDTRGRDLQVHTMNYYGKSLQYGCKYIHQSMPRMLTIWLDFASRATSRPISYANSEQDKLRKDALLKMTKIMEVYQERLPIFMWLTAFSQLVSRICHPSTEVQNTLCTILAKLIHAYPQHSLWMMASVINSSYPARQKRCQEILGRPKLKTVEMTKLIKDFHKLWERLIELSNKTIPDGLLNTTVTQLSRNLPRLLTSKDFSSIMIPTTKFRQLHLPSKGASLENYNPFSSKWVHIVGIEENVAVMPSLQRPRRITLRGSDGKEYLFMCKPKDDLRRDFRLMEFNDIVNKYLQNDPESRQRRLYIRTYSVVPLNEECGLVEWVPNLVGFRPIIMNLYKERRIAISSRELRSMLCTLKDPLDKKRKVFLEQLLPRHPSVLGDWFRLTFPDPYGWYEARTAYIRTTAVMSMVGYILGLGDRHGENILFDSKCGDCVHVDFNCLFNRGELFEWPERVPFRLTHNMVDAMGPLKIEGPFRRACEITMRVLRQQSSTLLSVLTPFVYDPLVSWNKNQAGEGGEKTNEKAVEHIKNIEQRLKGLIRSHGKKLENIALNLSVEGQTNHLILEATNVDNLCQMYFGWGAYI